MPKQVRKTNLDMFLVPFQKKGLENRSSRFESKNSWLSFSRGSGPPLKIKSVRTNEGQFASYNNLLDMTQRRCPVGRHPLVCLFPSKLAPRRNLSDLGTSAQQICECNPNSVTQPACLSRNAAYRLKLTITRASFSQHFLSTKQFIKAPLINSLVGRRPCKSILAISW